MYDQSFTLRTISNELRKSDFIKRPRLRAETVKAQELKNAVEKANGYWNIGNCLLESLLKGKSVFRSAEFSDELLIRKINNNLNKNFGETSDSRDNVIANLRELLSEGIEYRVYRLDIKNFYESINHSLIKHHLDNSQLISQPTKRFVLSFLDEHIKRGRSGVPRGLSLSATLANVAMKEFDYKIKQHHNVFYYGRYVDDIIIITDRKEMTHKFLKLIRQTLPAGLFLNNKKQKICQTSGDVKPHKADAPPIKELEFEYLGYQFIVTSPKTVNGMRPGQYHREVRLDIAKSKINKTKTRIARSFLSYNSDKNFEMLLSRLKFLSSNFSVMDADRDRKRMAGIFYNYHRINPQESEGLKDLDAYLIKVASSGWGNISSKLHSTTTVSQRRKILRISFARGFSEKTFLHFSHTKMSEIQRCWKYV
ncbi:antiviral reverse transcriptase Drt3a [Pseudomonas gingeri]|uniref:RNA-directed DNA polymerase n=2 Tax=Pseudomonas gingeri TaxID=117681 RepID=A0A7Y7XYU0_9PSED|nr:antiviral reverse transcriptase Drt3a [Pseudomonas gingeri]NWC13597.1 RNA-directed DNA polymerase [Pseudomonas gingeri]